ncbi:MAG: shikimate kinase, partial [Synergistaceae bacterium]|nr:shikimate kinase [Synergistaceae bacterium]
ADFGEDFFRKIESSILSEVCKESGLIVTTGGGVVTRAENKDIIRQNSTVIFIKRELNQLASEGRPLTQAKGVGQIYRERADLYSSWSDISVENVGFSETTEKIMEVLKL